jgi:hypothetical protein
VVVAVGAAVAVVGAVVAASAVVAYVLQQRRRRLQASRAAKVPSASKADAHGGPAPVSGAFLASGGAPAAPTVAWGSGGGMGARVSDRAAGMGPVHVRARAGVAMVNPMYAAASGVPGV